MKLKQKIKYPNSKSQNNDNEIKTQVKTGETMKQSHHTAKLIYYTKLSNIKMINDAKLQTLMNKCRLHYTHRKRLIHKHKQAKLPNSRTTQLN